VENPSILNQFVLYYEHHEDCPMEAAGRRMITEKRRILKWFRFEVAFIILTMGTKGRHHDKTDKR